MTSRLNLPASEYSRSVACMFRASESAAQLSLFPTGSLETQRQHHRTRGDRYRVRMGTLQWQRERDLAMERADYRCTDCGCEEALVVHHDSYEHVGDERPEELAVLCHDCHEDRHRAA